MPAVQTLQRKSFETPDETRTPPNTKLEIVKFGDMTVVRSTFYPGWRWSKDIGPIAGTKSCQVTHFGYVVSGRCFTRMDDGTEVELGPGDVVINPAGHDGWVVGDEPYVFIDFQGASRNL